MKERTPRPRPRIARCDACTGDRDVASALFVATATATAAPRLFVAGCGYVGLHVANEARSRGYEVSGSVRNAEKAENLRAAGFDAHVFDLDDGYTGLDDRGLAALASATHVLATVPPVADFDRDRSSRCTARAGGEGVAALGGLPLDDERVRRHGGGWVDERAETRVPAAAAPPRGCRPSASGLELRARSGGRLASHVFRLAGIYGPGRSALHTVARSAGTSVAAARARRADDTPPPPLLGHLRAERPDGLAPKYVSRVHVADIGAALLASMEAPAASASAAVYNIGDDEPAPRQEVMAHAAHLLGCRSPRRRRPARRASAPTARARRAQARRQPPDARRAAAARPRVPELPRGLQGGDRGHLDFSYKQESNL